MYQRTIGYLLLTGGLFAIIFSTLSLYEVYSGHKSPPQLINQAGLNIDISKIISQQINVVVPTQPNDAPTEILSSKTINSSFNLFLYFVAMSFVAGSGFKIASLGIQLLRPINIHSSVLN